MGNFSSRVVNPEQREDQWGEYTPVPLEDPQDQAEPPLLLQETAPKKTTKPPVLTKSFSRQTKESSAALIRFIASLIAASPLIIANAALGYDVSSILKTFNLPEEASTPAGIANALIQALEMAGLDASVMDPLFKDLRNNPVGTLKDPYKFARRLYDAGHSVNSIAGVSTLAFFRALGQAMAYFGGTQSFVAGLGLPFPAPEVAGAVAGSWQLMAGLRFEYTLWVISWLEGIKYSRKKVFGVDPTRYAPPRIDSTDLRDSINAILVYLESMEELQAVVVLREQRAARDPHRRLTDLVSQPLFKQLLWNNSEEAKKFQTKLHTFVAEYDANRVIEILHGTSRGQEMNMPPFVLENQNDELAEGEIDGRAEAAAVGNTKTPVQTMQDGVLDPQVWAALFGKVALTTPDAATIAAIKADLGLDKNAPELPSSDRIVMPAQDPKQTLAEICSYIGEHSAKKVVDTFTNPSRVDVILPRAKPTASTVLSAGALTAGFLSTMWFMLLSLNESSMDRLIRIITRANPEDPLPEEVETFVFAWSIISLVLTVLSLPSITMWAVEGQIQKLQARGLMQTLCSIGETFKNSPISTTLSTLASYLILLSMILTWSSYLFAMEGVADEVKFSLLAVSVAAGMLAYPPLVIPAINKVFEPRKSDAQTVQDYVTSTITAATAADIKKLGNYVEIPELRGWRLKAKQTRDIAEITPEHQTIVAAVRRSNIRPSNSGGGGA